MMCLIILIVLIFPQNTSAGVFSSFFNSLLGSENASAFSETSGSETRPNNSQTTFVLQAAVNSNQTQENTPSIVDNSALETLSGPSGTALEVEAKADTDKVSVYVVREGDTLSAIAKMFDVTPNTILWANDLKSSKDLKKGDQLVILPISGLKYVVKKGDTLKSIATKYHGDIDEITLFNDLTPSVSLKVGDEIIIPDGESVSDVSIVVSKKQSSAPSSLYTSAKGYFIKPANAKKSQGLHGKYLSGVDLAAPLGTAIYAAASGRVIIAKSTGYNGGYGKYIVIQHPNGMQTLYGHLSEVNISTGESVNQGDFIGKMGSTGHSTGSHLHFEILGVKNWNPFN